MKSIFGQNSKDVFSFNVVVYPCQRYKVLGFEVSIEIYSCDDYSLEMKLFAYSSSNFSKRPS